MKPSTTPGRGRPRDPATEQALLRSALQVLERDGYEGFTIEAVARQAGSSKVTLYRRWPSVGALLLAALARHGDETVPAATSEPWQKDLRQFFRTAFVQLNGRIGLVLRSLMAEAQGSDELRSDFRTRFIAKRRAALAGILKAALDRGELARGTDVELLLDFLFGAMWYRLLVAHQPLDRRCIEDFVDLVKRYT